MFHIPYTTLIIIVFSQIKRTVFYEVGDLAEVEVSQSFLLSSHKKRELVCPQSIKRWFRSTALYTSIITYEQRIFLFVLTYRNVLAVTSIILKSKDNFLCKFN